MAIGWGTSSAINAIAASEMTPGPLGMGETRPNADAPQAMASSASAGDLMQQIFTLGRASMNMQKPPSAKSNRPRGKATKEPRRERSGRLPGQAYLAIA